VDGVGRIDGEDVWSRLGVYWDRLGEEFDPIGTTKHVSEDTAIALALMLAKLERNLIAGLSNHQKAALWVYPYRFRVIA
jgi:hypothetical protein